MITEADGSIALIGETTPGRYALLDTQDWQERPLDIPTGTSLLPQPLLSPDGGQLALPSWSSQGQGTVTVIDLASGLVQTLMPTITGDLIEPIAWDGAALIVSVYRSASLDFWRLDPTAPSAAPQLLLHVGEAGLWAITPDGRALVWSYSGHALMLRDLRTGQDWDLSTVWAEFSRVTAGQDILLSSDGRTLAMLVHDPGGSGCLLSFADVSGRPPRRVAEPRAVECPGETINGQLEWAWAGDGESLLLVTGTLALRFARGGTPLQRTDLPPAASIGALRLAAGDQLWMVAGDDDHTHLRAIPLGSGHPTLDVPLPGAVYNYDLVYTPRRTP